MNAMKNITNWQTFQAAACSLYSEVFLDSWSGYLCIAINVALIITAITGNGLILAALRNCAELHPATKRLFLCLASTDLSVGLVTQPSFVIFLLSAVRKDWFSTCEFVVGFPVISTTILCGISLFTLTTISVDRLLALLLGLRYRQLVTVARIRRVTLLSWLIFSLLNLLYFWNARVFLMIVSLNVPSFLVVSTICYMKIYLTLRRRQTQVRHESDPGHFNSSLFQGRDLKFKRTVYSSMWFSITVIACYVPYFITAAVRVTRQDSSFFVLMEAFTASLIYFNSSINPLIYCWRIRELRLAVKAIIRRFCFFFCQKP